VSGIFIDEKNETKIMENKRNHHQRELNPGSPVLSVLIEERKLRP